MAQIGLVRKPGETPGQFSLRAAQTTPDDGEKLQRIARLYAELAYVRASANEKNRAQTLKKFIRAIADYTPDRRRAPIDAVVST